MNEVKDLVKSYRFGNDLKRFSRGRNNNHLHASIKNRTDIERYFTSAQTVIEQLSKNYDLVEEDIEYFKGTIADCEVCINKVIQMMDNIFVSEEWNYSYKDLKGLINRLFDLYSEFDKVKFRKACQD